MKNHSYLISLSYTIFRAVYGILKLINFHWTVAMKSHSYLISLSNPKQSIKIRHYEIQHRPNNKIVEDPKLSKRTFTKVVKNTDIIYGCP